VFALLEPHILQYRGFSTPDASSSMPEITATLNPGFSIRKNHLHASCSPIAGTCGTIATTAQMHLTSINFNAELLRDSQNHRVFTDSQRSARSGFENSETSMRALSSLL
jgi:hypothetical protein